MKISYLETIGWDSALRGMRNPMNSHNLSDSITDFDGDMKLDETSEHPKLIMNGNFVPVIGENDLSLCKRLIKAGSSHRKFLRMISINCDITASLKFFTEFDTYLFTVQNSTSQMHKMGSKLLTIEDFDANTDPMSIFIVNKHIETWKENKSEENWLKMIMSVPQGFLYTRTVCFNYEVFITQYFNRKNHKLYEWREYCETLKNDLPYMKEFLIESD